MPQYYTLEEAAKVLHMPLEELREKAKKKEVRAFQDRGNWRFLSGQIDEMARERGVGSDPDLQLGDLAKKAVKGDSDRLAVDFSLEDESVPLGMEKPGDKAPRSTKSGPKSPSPKSPNPSRQSGDSDVRLVMENEMDFQIELDSDVKIEPSGPKGGPKSSGTRSKGSRKSKIDDAGVRLVDKPSDSDVKLDPDSKGGGSQAKSSQSPSDSDIRLQDLPGSGKKKANEPGTITEEIDLDAEQARAASKAPPAKPKPASKFSKAPVLPSSSPFELSEHDLNLDDDPPSSKSKLGGPKSGASKLGGPKSGASKLGGPKSGASKLGGPKSGGKKSKVEDDTDSSSDFELIPFDASKSPADLGSGDIPLLSDDEVGLGDLHTPSAGNSGINLREPADSGISLESGGSDEIEFELSLDDSSTPKPVSKKPSKGEEDSSSEFELKAADDSDSEFELSLDDAPSDDSDSEFELSLDESADDETIGLQSMDSPEISDNSDSEFELTLDDEGGLVGVDEDEEGKDIFEETNFDVPALDEDESGSEAVALDDADTDLEASDFEISLDEDSDTDSASGSQVVALDEEEDADDAAATIARPRKTKGRSKLVVDDDEQGLDLDLDEDSAPRAKGRQDEDEDAETAEDDEEDEVVSAVSAPPAEWGALPAILLAPTVIVMFVVGLMGFELVQSMWGYHRPAKVGRPVIDFLARSIVDENLPKD